MRTLLAVLLAIVFLMSCNEKRQPTINYNQPEAASLTMDSLMADTSKVLVADLPVYFDSTRVLIHTIGFVEINDRQRSRLEISKSSYDESSKDYMYTNKGKYTISGSITNLFFEDLDTNTSRHLTDKALNITHIEYLREVARATNNHFLIYTLYDKDYNNDKMLDSDDLPALYISSLNGANFTKLTKDYHTYHSGSLVLLNMRYYFRTIEDTNKDGYFNKKDKYHYYYIDLRNNPYSAVEYNPIGMTAN